MIGNSSLVKKKISGYRKTFEKYGATFKALQWADKKAAVIRYHELTTDLNFGNKSILDVGCGFGDIVTFIEKKTKVFSYTGVDVVPEFIKEAKKRYPKHSFILGDYFGKPLKDKFDIVVSSGTLNANAEDALSYRKRSIRTLWEQANYAVAFNMAGSHPQPENKKDGRVYYADSLEALTFCLGLTNKVIFRHHYHNNDFTMVLIK